MPNRNIEKSLIAAWAPAVFLAIASTATFADTPSTGPSAASGISLCPANSHYIQIHGKPTILVGSTEHYGAALNLDFDYIRYLDTLATEGMNLTRTFSGAYVEPAGAFNISNNTLAPVANRLILPWARSQTPGYANGGNKFDLNQWDDAYFKRLHDFVAQAGRRGIVVEVVLFCPYYDEGQWKVSPLNAINNVNDVGDLARTSANTLLNGKLLQVQDEMVRKFASELKDLDNFYFEICNEPYFAGVTADWQDHIAATIHDAEKNLPAQHLIARNISNGSKKIEQPSAFVSIYNFHYATPPNAVAENYGLNKVIADDETGFKGTGDAIYRMEAWDFLMAGGGIFDHLDYSFTPGHEDGTAPIPPKQPGGGGVQLRKQFKILKDFIDGFDFISMKPDSKILRSTLPKGVTARVLAADAKAYGIYFRGAGLNEITVALPPGKYHAQWINTLTGVVDKSEDVAGGDMRLAAPKYDQDIAMRIVAR